MKAIFAFACLLYISLSHTQAQSLRFFEFDFHSPYPDSLNLFAATSDSSVLADCDAQLLLPDSLRDKHINGSIDHGTADNNAVYSWHFVQSAWSLADFSVEVCDGRPLEDVEADTAYWIGTVGYFCPWNSYVKREVGPTGLDVVESAVQVQLGPLPFEYSLHVRNGGAKPVQIHALLDAQGMQLRGYGHVVPARGRVSLDMAGLPAGVYFLVMRGAEGYLVKRIVRG